jgi:hypothetical protein
MIRGDGEIPNPDDRGAAGSFNAHDVDPVVRQILGETFAEMTVWNEAVIRDFDPNLVGAQESIELNSTFGLYEEQVLELVANERFRMLAKLGLTFELLGDKDPHKLFQYTYGSNAVRQIRLMEREADGVKIPVFFALGDANDPASAKKIKLMSHDVADDRVAREAEKIEESRIEQRIKREAPGIEVDDLSLADKHILLKHIRAAENTRTATPDKWELNQARGTLARAVTSTSNFPLLAAYKRRRLPRVTAAYQHTLSQFIGRHDPTARQVEQIIADERSQRLAALEKNVIRRQRIAKVGQGAMVGTVTVTAAVAGAAIGHIPDLPHYPLEEAYIAGYSAWQLGVRRARKYLKSRPYQASLTAIRNAGEQSTLPGQLVQEAGLIVRE